MGGLVGWNSNSTVSNSYATGLVTGGSFAGALFGTSPTTVSHTFYDKTVNPTLTGIAGTADTAATVWGMSTTNMKSAANFTSATAANGSVNPGWDFTAFSGIWASSAAANTGYPCLLGVACSNAFVRLTPGSSNYGDVPNLSYGIYTSSSGGALITDANPSGTAIWSSPLSNTSAVNSYSESYVSGVSLGNALYMFNVGSAATWNITQRPISLKANDQSRAYGSSNPSTGAVSLTAGTLANTDALGTASLTSTATSTTAASQTAALTPSSQIFTLGNASNYAITYVDGTLSITQRPISVNATDQSRAYGNANPSSGAVTLTAGTLASSDSLGTATLSSPASSTTAAGQSAALTPSSQSFTLGNTSNYAITYIDGALTITQRPISVKANDQSRVYGNANPSTGAVTLTAGTLANSDTLGTATVTSPATATTAAGQTLALTPSNQNFTLGAANNYTITYVDGTLAITPAPFATQAATVSQLPVLPPQLAIDANLPLAAAERVTSNPVAIPVHVNMEPVSVGNGQASDQIAVYVMRPASVDQSGAMAVALPKALFGTANGFSFALPSQLMDAAHQATAIRVSLVGGEPLPEWMAFHAESKRFVVSALPGDAFPLHIMVQIGDLAATIDIFEAMQWAPLERL